MSYWLHEDAELELGDASVYYAQNASRKIAIAFLEGFERVIEILELNQQLGTPKEEGMRSYPFRKFPYFIAGMYGVRSCLLPTPCRDLPRHFASRGDQGSVNHALHAATFKSPNAESAKGKT